MLLLTGSEEVKDKYQNIIPTLAQTVPEDLVRVPKPSIALEKGLLFLLLNVGVVMAPSPPSLRLLTLVLLPAMFQVLSGLVTAWGVADITAARNCSASILDGTSCDWPG